jgi:hypothetical protein
MSSAARGKRLSDLEPSVKYLKLRSLTLKTLRCLAAKEQVMRASNIAT